MRKENVRVLMYVLLMVIFNLGNNFIFPEFDYEWTNPFVVGLCGGLTYIAVFFNLEKRF